MAVDRDAGGLGEGMEAFLRSLLAGEIGMQPDEVSATVSLERYGVESVLVLKLTQQLEERFGPLPKTLFFEMQTLRELAAYFTENHGPAVAALLAPEAERRDQPARQTEAPRRRPATAGRTMPGSGGRSRFLPSARGPAPASAAATTTTTSSGAAVASTGDRPAPERDPAAPIAIIGISGRYPQAQDLAVFWRNLRDGRDCITEIPADRWDWRTDFDPEIGRVGTSYAKWGGFIDEIDRFDARFFHIAPKEAEVADPQERLFLETVHHTLEDAGYTSATLDPEGRRVGVFVGVMWGQYQLYGATRPDLMPLSAYWGIANRVSYVFDFKGPSLAVDTACSSSLTAVHLACESLRRGECRVAIAGGVNLTLHPDKYIILSQSRFASTDGRCRSFGAGGDGYVPGEGVGALMLKPLARARADGDVLHGVILGSALNHGGKTTGYTVPNPDAQADTVRRALDQARLDPGAISYLEAHGTGTALGDPVEIRGLAKVFAAGRREDAPPCAIGSVKSNIGHLESAAGVAGITKVLLQMRHGALVPSLHADTPNPNLEPDLERDGTPFRLQRRLGAWPATPGQPRRAGVSSFGAGGANAHIILEEPPATQRTADETPDLFVVSAASEAQRDQLVRALLDLLRGDSCPLGSVLYTLQVGRAALRHRLAAIVDTPARLIERLDRHCQGQGPVDGVFVGEGPEGADAGSAAVDDALERRDWAALARLWTGGAGIDWHRLHAGGPTPSRVSLPPYPFDRKRYWVKEGRRTPGRDGGADTPGPLHPLVQVNGSTFKEQRYTSQFARDQFFLRDHRFNGVAILPGAIQLEMARIAGTLAGERTVHGVEALVWHQPAATDGTTLTVAIALYPDADGADFEVRRMDGPADPAPSVCCQGRLVMGEGAAAAGGNPVDLAAVRARCPNRLDTEALYRRLEAVGLDYGPAFRGLAEAFHSKDELLARLVLPDSVDLAFRNACPLHPVLIDGALQSVVALLAVPDGFHLPYGIGALRFAVDALPDRLWVHGCFAPDHAQDRPLFDLALIDDDGRPLASLSRFALRAVPRLAAARGDREASPTPVAPPDAAATVHRARLEAWLTECLAAQTGEAVAQIALKEPLETYGLDSVMVLELTRTLESRFGPLSKTLFFEVRTLADLADYFLESHPNEVAVLAGGGGTGPAKGSAAVADLPPAPPSARAVTRPRFAVGSGSGSSRSGDAVAIIGLSGRYPLAEDLTAFWHNLAAGRDCIREFPLDRWRRPPTFDPTPGTDGATYSKWGGFLDDIDRFDALFFNISPKEAKRIDPQERLFLETVHHTLEDAGYRARDLDPADGLVGVFVGVMWGHYQLFGVGRPVDKPGANYWSIANRVSYQFDFHGPSLAVDTACSSSLTALHLACENLRHGLCRVAIAGGVNLTTHPDKYPALSQARFLSTDGRCRSFGEGGDGYVPGEGVGAALLKSLEAARRDGDRIWGVIRGSALNHDGKTNGYSVPNPDAQSAVISAALGKAGVSAAALSYVEAHGTGTALGDPIEIAGLTKAFGKDDTKGPGVCAIGSAKASIGHLESAAGIAGVTKVLLQMRHGQLVPSLHADPPNPHVDFDATPFRVQRRLADWLAPATDGGAGTKGARRLFAGVSSFGAGGANAHLILESHPSPPPDGVAATGPVLVILSAREAEPLRVLAGRLRDHVLSDAARDQRLVDIAFTLQIGREPLPHRLAVVTDSQQDLAERLERFLAGTDPAGGVLRGEVTAKGGTLPVALDDAAGRAYLRAVMAAGDLGKLATLWLSGVEIDWRGLYGDPAPRRVALPLYPFVRERHWTEDIPVLADPLPASVATAPEPDGGEGHAADAADGAEPRADARSMRRNTVAYLRSVLASVIDLAPEKIGLDEPFESFGLDSVMILALTTALEARFGTLPKTLFFEVQSLSQLAHFLFENFEATVEAEFGQGPGLKSVGPAKPPAQSSPVAQPGLEPAAAPRSDEPMEIAVIGVAGRYPTADSLPAFWQALREGRDCISEIPAGRWDFRLHYDPALNRAGASYSKWGGFLDDVTCFDPLFFNISPREAERIDPQERLFLETVHHTLEDAGYTAANLDPDRRIGLFVGVTWGLYQMHEADSPDTLPASFFWSVANRASFLFDFQGPSLAVDTACSSSLSALHLACESLRRGESRVAIAGGVNLTVHPNKYIMLGQSQFTSTDGRCRSFGEGGDGYVPGEGVGAVLLKPLAQAIRDRDRIQAVIKATSANHGGKTNGYSVPSPDAQARLIGEALARARVDPRTISYVEAHGTGTALGDPIEIRGLVKALGRDRPADLPLVVGSAKSNIGHLESAAGIAGVTKVLLQMKHGQIAPSLHSKTLNPYLAFDGAPLHIQQTLTDWTAPTPLRAGVSSFGAGGANGHVILEAWREARPPCRTDGPALVPLSAKSSGSLKAAAGNLLAHVRTALAQRRQNPEGAGGPGPSVPPEQTTAIRAELAGMVASLLAVEPQDLAPDEPLSAFGLDAVQLAALRQALEQRWSDQVADGADVLADDPSLDQVSRRLAEAGPAIPGPAADGPPDPNPDPDLTDLTLADLAYTLQVGRDAMPLRLALVVDSLEALCAGLRAFLDGEARGGLVHGRAQPPAAASGDDLDADAAALAPEVAAALRAHDLDQLACQWVGGQRIDWPQLHGATEPRRIALPLYPFARERYWVPEIETAPLRHRVKSAQELMPDRVGSLAGFQPVWQPRPLPEVPLDGARGVVVVGDEALADRLRADLPGVVSATNGAAFEPTGHTGFRLPVSDDIAWRHLFQTVADRGLSVHYVVVCCHEDRPADQQEPDPPLAEATWRFLAPHVALARGLLAVQPEAPTQVLSLGLFDAPTEAACLAQALAGFGKTLALETETLSYRTVLVGGDDARVETLAGHLVREFAVTGGEVEVRYRHGTREAKRFQTFPLADTADRPPPPIRQHGVYLITGGAGGIGSLFADALAAQHQARLILIGRSALDDDKRRRLEALRRLGAQEALYIPADITRRDSVTALITEVKQRFGTVHGILHAAGTILPALITKAEWANVARILAPKVVGTLNLDAAIRDEPIDFLMLFSSISGAIGDVGLADYAYANAFLDHFAHYRNELRRQGHRHGRTLAVNWPAWKDGGMQLPAETRELLFRTWGMIPMPTNEGLEAFRAGLTRDDDHFVVGYGDPVKLERRICEVRPLDLPASGATGADTAERDRVRRQLEAALSARIAAILKVPPERIEAAAEMSEYGFESITLTEFANQLNEAFDLDLTPAVFYRHTTLDAVIGFLLDTAFQTIAAALAEPRPQATGPATAVASDDDDDEAQHPAPPPAAPAIAEPRVEAARLEPVAIIGMDGILPGSPDLETFWDHLDHGRDLIREIPPARWDVARTYDPTGRDPTRANTKWAGTIDDVDLFDAKFFKISRREAELMDPQHRLLLEVVWRTVENAGYRISALAKDPVGLFVGAQFQDYQLLIRDALTESSAQTATGNQLSLLVNRVSYLFDFTGPSLAVDTACSGALVALHQAVRSIQLGECATALVGGANLLLAPETLINTARLGVLSPDGRCKTFDTDADGYVKGEGIVAVLLKPLSRAVADKDTIHAVVAGSAVNHGGRSNSMTAPSPEAQARVIVQACRRAAVAPETIGYIECHGTGTRLGDPVEIEGLKEAFDLLGAPKTDRPFCGLGSVKTNIGHLEPAAGLAGLIKVVLAMRHRRLPATLHLKTPNPFIKLRGSPFYLLDQARPWEPPDGAQGQMVPLRAGVSSFGIGGTNAHVVLEKPPAPGRPGAPLRQAGPVLVVLSARDDERLRAYAGRLIAFLERTPAADLPAVAWTLQTGREPMAARLAVVAHDADHLLDRLRRFRDGAGPADGVYQGIVKSTAQAPKEGNDPAAVDALARQHAFDRLAALWVLGAAVTWSLLYPDEPPARVPLPTYPFARTRFWLAETKEPPAVAGDAHDTVAFVPLWRPSPLSVGTAPESPSSNSDAGGRRDQGRSAVLLLGGERACADRLRQTAPVVELALDADLSAVEDVPAQVVVCFDQATLEGDAGGETSGEAVMARALDTVLAPLLALIQAGAARRHRIQALLIVAACRPEGLGAVVAGALGGLVRTLVLETAVASGRTVLTPPLPGTDLADLINRELSAAHTGDQEVRYHDGLRQVRVWQEHAWPPAPQRRPVFRDGGIYLITGGLGGVGWLFARHLAERHRARLLLTGRSAPSDRHTEAMDMLRGFGAEVLYRQGDVADAAAVADWIAALEARWGACHGVIHCAGVLADGPFRDRSRAAVAPVLAPKVAGTLALDRATRDRPLDFLVLFSSMTALFGNIGQGAYAFANGFMDRFAHWREAERAAGRRHGQTLAIDWPLWAEGGMQVDETVRRRLFAQAGVAPLPTDVGIATVIGGLQLEATQLIVVHGAAGILRPLFSRDGAPAPAAVPPPRPAAVTPTAPAEARPRRGQDLAARIGGAVLEAMAEILKLDPKEIAPDDDLSEHGFDSITLTELTNALNGRFGLDLTPAVMFECPTLALLVAALERDHGAALDAHFAALSEPDRREPIVPAATAPEPAETPAPPPVPPAAPAAGDAPIAIIGMGGILPGSPDLDAFWDNLEQGRDLIREIPADRWDWRAFDGDPGRDPRKTRVRWGGFIDGIDRLDGLFFGISPKEARLMDPQQRLFLQVVWHTLEDAGVRPSDIAGSATGVFVGVSYRDYQEVIRERITRRESDAGTGNAGAIVANRVSYRLDLRGPSEPVDTACSSSLTAIHRAIESIRHGGCTMAIAGGVHAILDPWMFILLESGGMLAPDGRCKTFDQSADGFGRGEGVGAVLLKPLAQALADGNPVHGVIRGSAINHGGRARSLTSPSPAAQAALIVEAHRNAGISPDTVGYIEAHGTGTSLGDPIEIDGLKKAFATLYAERGLPQPDRPHCAIGSVKTNIGHLEPAAGIAGVLKVLLMLRHRAIPGTVHLKAQNPYIRLDRTPFHLAEATHPWTPVNDPAGKPLPRRAGVSSFGFGGSNAHVVLEEFTRDARAGDRSDAPQLVLLSARSPERLAATAAALLAFLTGARRPPIALPALAWTLQSGREAMDERLAVAVSDLDALIAVLRPVARSPDAAVAGVHRGNARRDRTATQALIAGDAGTVFLDALMRARDLDKLASLWVTGIAVDWSALHGDGLPSLISLPTYPFEPKRHWMDPVVAESGAAAPVAAEALAAPQIPDAADTVVLGRDAGLAKVLPAAHPIDPVAADADRCLARWVAGRTGTGAGASIVHAPDSTVAPTELLAPLRRLLAAAPGGRIHWLVLLPASRQDRLPIVRDQGEALRGTHPHLELRVVVLGDREAPDRVADRLKVELSPLRRQDLEVHYQDDHRRVARFAAGGDPYRLATLMAPPAVSAPTPAPPAL